MRLLYFFIFFFMFVSASANAEEKVAAVVSDTKEDKTPEEYKTWLDNLKKEMIKKGISEETILAVYPEEYYPYKPEVITLDGKQPEFLLTTTDYLNRIVSKKRVEQAQKNYKILHHQIKDIEEEYGVPARYLISFWGAETNFGSSLGRFNLIETLTTLSYRNRRSDFFKSELYEALKILDKYEIEAKDMESSWAGAFGHFQFMPSTFNNYAIDFDEDGVPDVWNSFDDAIASASNYLSKLGWKKEQPCFIEVKTDALFDYSNTGLDKQKTVKEWKKLKVKSSENKVININDNLSASLIVPEGKKGKVYLVFDNFRKVMIWNRSENYALAICKISDYILSGNEWEEENKHPAVTLKTEDILTVQKFINANKIGQVDEDGKLGKKTKEAIKKLQKKALLPQDGYPDYLLLRKINNYDSKIGFSIPVQPTKKIHK